MFTRVELRDEAADGGRFFEVPQVHWINPRQLHRRLIRIVEDRGFEVEGDETEFHIEREAIGATTGVVRATVAGYRRAAGDISFLSTPFRTWGIVLAVLGVLALGLVIAGSGSLRIAGAVAFGAFLGLGVLLFLHKRPGWMPGYARLQFRILMEGEVTERTVTEQGTTATSLMAQLALSAASSNVHQADGSRATAAERDAFKAHFRDQVEEDETAFSAFLAVQSPFWDALDPDVRAEWEALRDSADEDFAALEQELAALSTEFHAVTPTTPIRAFTSPTEMDAAPNGELDADPVDRSTAV